ncbi:MAG: hypothetical protein NDJ19_00695 [Ramlibacter sp.]|nr:hypothetical protein [Ramlibacter sp.]
MRAALLAAVALLAGCAGLTPGAPPLENRVVCTVARDRAYTVSLWGPAGLTAQIAAADAAVICARPPPP